MIPLLQNKEEVEGKDDLHVRGKEKTKVIVLFNIVFG